MTYWYSMHCAPSEEGSEIIGWLTTDKGFSDIVERLYLSDGYWHWHQSETPVTRQDFILGWLPYPTPAHRGIKL